MREQYRLRLADGTLLIVDHDALTTWLVDDKALVQPVGFRRWRRLKQFLADERYGIGPDYWDEPAKRPGVPSKDGRRGPRRSQAPQEEKETVRGVVSGWVDAFAGAARKLRAPTPEPAAEESHSSSSDMAPLLQALRRAEIPLDVPSTPQSLSPDLSAEAQPLAAVEAVPLQLEPAEAAPVPMPDQSTSWEWDAPQAPALPEPEPEIEITVNKVFPLEAIPAPRKTRPKRRTKAAAPAPPPAAEERLPDLEITVNKLLPLEPIDHEVTGNRHLPLEPEPPVAPILSEEAEALRAAASEWLSAAEQDSRDFLARPVASAPPPHETPSAPETSAQAGLQVLADDPMSLSPAADRAPAIRLKPLPPETSVPAQEVDEEEGPASQVVWGSGPLGRFLGFVAEGSEVITEWLEKGKQAWAQRSRASLGERLGDEKRRGRELLAERAGATRVLFTAWRVIIGGWIESLKAWIASHCPAPRIKLSEFLRNLPPPTEGASRKTPSPAPELPPALPIPLEEDFDSSTPEPMAGGATPSITFRAPTPKVKPVMPPPPISELPTLRFADPLPAPEEDEDLYDDGPGALEAVALGAKRIVLTGALAAAVLVAAGTWEKWWPGLERRSGTLFATIEKHTRSPRLSAVELESKRKAEALEAATQQLPHLDTGTIELLMARDVQGIPDPLEVFRRAYEATERGLAALAPEEAEALRALNGTLLAALRPRERERLRDYDRMRRVRVTLPFEEREVLELLARAASSLAPEQRARLQSLNGKAIASALAR